jgi:hypothetical protein
MSAPHEPGERTSARASGSLVAVIVSAPASRASAAAPGTSSMTPKTFG